MLFWVGLIWGVASEMPWQLARIIFSPRLRIANSRRYFTELLAMDKDDKTKAAVKQLRARLMTQVKKIKGLKTRRQELLDENRELTIAIAKKRGETL